MDDDLDAATGLASLTSSGITPALSRKGKPRASRRTATTPKKKEMMPEEQARESAKRKGRRHAMDTRDEAATVANIAAATKREDTAPREEDEVDIDREPLFEDELANQAAGVQPKRKSRRTKAYTAAEDKLTSLEAFKVQHESKSFNLSHCWRIIKDEEKFKLQYAALRAHGGKEAVEEVGEGEKPRPREKTNSKKEDKRDAASIALIATVKGMMTKKDSREEKHRQDKEEQMNAFMKIQKRRLEMQAKNSRMLEMEAEKQAKMIEIEAVNGKTKTKEVALASMMMGVETMKVDLHIRIIKEEVVFKKMQADMFKFDDE
ncbi:Phospholipid-transporting ATPase 1 [Hordeum vulgare]|nr:Phospholipid-transporting ATPase 1 [Hordeum vulgare]